MKKRVIICLSIVLVIIGVFVALIFTNKIDISKIFSGDNKVAEKQDNKAEKKEDSTILVEIDGGNLFNSCEKFDASEIYYESIDRKGIQDGILKVAISDITINGQKYKFEYIKDYIQNKKIMYLNGKQINTDTSIDDNTLSEICTYGNYIYFTESFESTWKYILDTNGNIIRGFDTAREEFENNKLHIKRIECGIGEEKSKIVESDFDVLSADFDESNIITKEYKCNNGVDEDDFICQCGD